MYKIYLLVIQKYIVFSSSAQTFTGLSVKFVASGDKTVFWVAFAGGGGYDKYFLNVFEQIFK